MLAVLAVALGAGLTASEPAQAVDWKNVPPSDYDGFGYTHWPPDGDYFDKKWWEAMKSPKPKGIDPKDLEKWGGRWVRGDLVPSDQVGTYARQWANQDYWRWQANRGWYGEWIHKTDFNQIRDNLINAGRKQAGRVDFLAGTEGWTAGDDLRAQMIIDQHNELAGGTKKGNFVRGKWANALAKLGQIPGMKALGTISAAAFAFEIGWKIGDLVMKIPGNPLSDPPVTSGPTIFTIRDWVARGPGESYAVSPCPGDAKVFSQGGWMVMWQRSTGSSTPCAEQTVEVGDPPPAKSCEMYSQMPSGGVSSGAVIEQRFLSTSGTTGTCRNHTRSGFVMYSDFTVAGFEPYAGQPVDKTSSLPAEPNLGTQRQRAEEILQDPAYGPVNVIVSNPWLEDSGKPKIDDSEFDEDLIMVTIPHPGTREHYEDYKERVEKRGLEVIAQPVRLRERQPDREVGAVLRVRPKAGSQVAPGAQVNVEYNPAEEDALDDPEAAPGGGGTGWSPPKIRDFDFDPLEKAVSCDVFPFGLVCWLGTTLGGWSGGSSCPAPVTINFSVSNLELSPCVVEPIMPMLRALITLSTLVGFTMVAGTIAMKLL